MKYRSFSIPVQNPAPAEDELNRFLAAHRIVAIDREFVADGWQSLWCFSVSYLDSDGSAPEPPRGKIDYRWMHNMPRVKVATGEQRVTRGGSWDNHARNCRSAQRNHREPANRNDWLGFRLARARDRAGRRVWTRPSSCPCRFTAKSKAAGMLVGGADAPPKACRPAAPLPAAPLAGTRRCCA